ncbi:L-type lectin family protein [Lacticaseibacillus saniviri]
MKLRHLLLFSGLIIGMSASTQTAHAATDWMNPLNSTTYTAPPDITSGTAGYVPFGDSFTTLGTSKLITQTAGGTTQNVGLAVTQAANNQNGAIWSKSPIFDLTKQHQTVSMNVLLQQSSLASGDGMTLALSGKKPNAPLTPGAQLGVWAGEYNSTNAATSDYLKAALPSSAIVTLDTHFDKTLDGKLPGNKTNQYIGLAYPGLANSYYFASNTNSTSTSDKYIGQINFNNVQTGMKKIPYSSGVYLASPASAPVWHNFDVVWDRDADNSGGTLTYRVSNTALGQASGVSVNTVHWTNSDITTIFGTNNVYVGFTGSTSTTANEDAIVSFHSIPGTVNASGTVKLTKGTTAVTSSTQLRPSDQLAYNYNVTYDNSSSANWPSANGQSLSIKLTKNKYFLPTSTHITVTYGDGSTGTATLATSRKDPATIILSGIKGFTKGTSGSIKFVIPMNVGPIDKTDLPITQSRTYSDDAGIIIGDNAQVHIQNTDTTAPDPFSVGYTLFNTGLTYVPASPTLSQVPSLAFINFHSLVSGGSANPSVIDLSTGKFTSTDLPEFQNVNDLNNPTTGLATIDDQLLAMQSPDNEQAKLTVDSSATSKWRLAVSLAPFTSDAGPFSSHAHIAFFNTTGASADNSPVSYWPSNTAPVSVSDNNQSTDIMNSDSAKLISSNTTPKAGFDVGAGSVLAILHFDDKMPLVQRGTYQSTAVWSLTVAP